MELYSLRVFQAVITEKSFSRAAEKLSRTQPAISLAVQRLEQEIGEKLIDRSGKELLLTDAGRIAFDFARRFDHLISEMNTALAEMRDNSAGVLIVGANESTSLYVLQHIVRYRRLYPKVKVRVRRSLTRRMIG
jgi:DNA-binding transcriptional LysR family regulator